MMATFIAQRIEEACDRGGVEDGRTKYEQYFVNTRLYLKWRAEVDTIISTDGYEACIVA